MKDKQNIVTQDNHGDTKFFHVLEGLHWINPYKEITTRDIVRYFKPAEPKE